MKTIRIKLSENAQTYPIHIGQGILARLESIIPIADYSSVVVITDAHVRKAINKIAPNAFLKNAQIIIVPSGEEAKTIQTVQTIWEKLSDFTCDRSSLVITVGGGTISDVGGFAASTYLRGIDFINIPTTLLSQVDASIGGKTGINFNGVKNNIGTFAQPKAVIIDIDTLQSLPKRIFTEGFGEIIKHGIIADKKYFALVTSKNPEEFSKEELIDIIEGSCRIKAEIVQQDITEQGLRRLINFGHTVGHAIEAASLSSKNPLLHGEAVSIGMVAEAKLSALQKLLSERERDSIIKSLAHAGLPTEIHGVNKKTVLEKLLHDKKRDRGAIKWTLVEKIGKGRINQIVPSALVEQVIGEVVLP